MRSANWFLNIHLYLMNSVTKLPVGTSMIRETQKNIEKAGFEIVGKPRTTGDGYYESVVMDPEQNRVEITI